MISKRSNYFSWVPLKRMPPLLTNSLSKQKRSTFDTLYNLTSMKKSEVLMRQFPERAIGKCSVVGSSGINEALV